MNLNLEGVNPLPVRTWSWLGINDITIEEEIPEILPFQKNPLITKGIRNEKDILFAINDESGHKVLSDRVITKDAEIVRTMEEVSAIPTGMGENTANYIRNNSNTGIFLRIPAGKKYKEPIYLEYDLEEENKTVVDFNTIYAEEDSEVTVVMHYKSRKGISAFHSGLTYMVAGKNAIINLLQIQLLSEETLHLNDIGAVIENGGAINLVHTELGGSNAYNGCKVDLKGSNSKINIETIYFGDKKRTIDMNYVMNHYGKNSNSRIHVNGALLDQSSKTFRGTIDFKKGASGSVGHEEEYNLLFSPKIKNLTAPLILCQEDDVEGKHGANSGKIDENKLFYMMTRGLDELSAKKMMIEAAFRPAMEQIPFTGLQDQISEYVKERLNNIESI
ncbi:Fe-S cluster assembly protein SufD [Anaerocolumna aminovalerica]|uniref:Fe-S cluster assembly protein SufD n=1 Tax=Anaerocolumna aminovalerica TaxID=1527 RepID=UPI001C0EC92D|nr:Fe-S cluster assembly protein SufD [Anaerocolumna aminovalerica]MBU5331286.1 Fe-S cluster assembly protein SufD [Anaerocolumna aminovalerica]